MYTLTSGFCSILSATYISVVLTWLSPLIGWLAPSVTKGSESIDIHRLEEFGEGNLSTPWWTEKLQILSYFGS